MKLRLDKVLTDLDGEPLKVPKTQAERNVELDVIEKANKDLPDDQKDKTNPDPMRNMTIRDICDVALLGVEREPKKEIDAMEKEARYILAVKIRRGDDLGLTERGKLKDLIGQAYRIPLVVGQMSLILDGKELEHGKFKTTEGE